MITVICCFNKALTHVFRRHACPALLQASAPDESSSCRVLPPRLFVAVT